jgi:hypothetical protein
MGMIFDRNDLINDVLRRLSVLQEIEADTLDFAEMVVELQQEFGRSVVYQALEIFNKRGGINRVNRVRPPSYEPEPMWDRDLDG